MNQEIWTNYTNRKNKTASVSSSRNGCATIDIPQPLRYVQTDFARYHTVGEVDAES
jgi:hypothetical protein